MLNKLCSGRGIFDFNVEGYVLLESDIIESRSSEINGKIIVANIPYPDAVISLYRCLAYVAQSGGITSHLAVLGREMGVPVVVGATGIFSSVKTGDYVIIDSISGEATIYEKN